MKNQSANLNQSMTTEFAQYFNRAVDFIKIEWKVFLFFILLLFVEDLFNFYLQNQVIGNPESSRYIEIYFQVLLLWTNVFYIHSIHSIKINREVSKWRIFGESFLLLPGFILQSILWFLSFVLGLCLLVIPGIYTGIIFYMAPILSVLYPDYRGTTFLLAKKFSSQNFKNTAFLIILTSFIPFIPEGLLFFLTGTMKSIWSLLYSPFGGALYFFFELIFILYVYEFVKEDRASQL
ncbi:MAG: hypothetical protein CME63_05815 [Halobacteriovoraceae bacterium]|nr:hypothetical protein [Halobacteriovoraceae bacterium]|tara:strand:+ start:32800 stop:33504 length:705 start_codon:yes stop_codon:yes gene_type:complete